MSNIRHRQDEMDTGLLDETKDGLIIEVSDIINYGANQKDFDVAINFALERGMLGEYTRDVLTEGKHVQEIR